MRSAHLRRKAALSLFLAAMLTTAPAVVLAQATDALGSTPDKTAGIVQGQNPASGSSAPAQSASAGVAKQPMQERKAFRLQIGRPENKDCLAKGNCTLDDIVYTGTSFAELLTVLAGALFLVAFIYGGFMYLISAGDKDRVKTGKNAMKTASIGMVIVLGAYSIVNYVVSSIIAQPK